MPPDPNIARRRWLAVLAKASPDEMARCWAALPVAPSYEFLRRPEIGLVMVRGRIGGDGGPFNLGEMTVTRCSIRLDDGTVGHAWVAGRAPDQAERVAVLDGLLQGMDESSPLHHAVTAIAASQMARAGQQARKAAATRVDFFTMTRARKMP